MTDGCGCARDKSACTPVDDVLADVDKGAIPFEDQGLAVLVANALAVVVDFSCNPLVPFGPVLFSPPNCKRALLSSPDAKF